MKHLIVILILILSIFAFSGCIGSDENFDDKYYIGYITDFDIQSISNSNKYVKIFVSNNETYIITMYKPQKLRLGQEVYIDDYDIVYVLIDGRFYGD